MSTSASTSAMFDYECDIYQPENYVPGDDDFSSGPVFSFDFFSINSFSGNPCMYNKLDVLQEHILRESISWSTISSKLSELNVPYHAHPGMIQKITTYARSAANEDHNIGCEIIPLIVIIKTTVNNTYEELAISDAVSRSIDGQVLNLVPASKNSIASLQKIKVEGYCWKQCVICLEDMLVGSEAARMPCLHIYHENCIANWLNQSNLCPLCRFQMP